MSELIEAACRYAQSALAAQADAGKAPAMQAYMKTSMPFYGVKKPLRVPILRHLVHEFPPSDRVIYEELVLALWRLPHREEKYLAQGVATGHRQFMVPDSLPLYRRLIVEGSWWDLVDEVATHMVRELVLAYPEETWPVVDLWVDDQDMWLRRTAIICQVGAKAKTDADRLFGFCLRRSDEEEFFIRKAIGWALREYSKTDPGSVGWFVAANRDRLSGLSFREANKHLQGLT